MKIENYLSKQINAISDPAIVSLMLDNYDLLKKILENTSVSEDVIINNNDDVDDDDDDDEDDDDDDDEDEDEDDDDDDEISVNLHAFDEVLAFIKNDPGSSTTNGGCVRLLKILEKADDYMRNDPCKRFDDDEENEKPKGIFASPTKTYKSIFEPMSDTNILKQWTCAYIRLMEVVKCTHDNNKYIEKSMEDPVFVQWRKITKLTTTGACLDDKQAYDQFWSIYETNAQYKLHVYAPIKQLFVEFVLVTLASIKLTGVVIYNFKKFVDPF